MKQRNGAPVAMTYFVCGVGICLLAITGIGRSFWRGEWGWFVWHCFGLAVGLYWERHGLRLLHVERKGGSTGGAGETPAGD